MAHAAPVLQLACSCLQRLPRAAQLSHSKVLPPCLSLTAASSWPSPLASSWRRQGTWLHGAVVGQQWLPGAGCVPPASTRHVRWLPLLSPSPRCHPPFSPCSSSTGVGYSASPTELRWSERRSTSILPPACTTTAACQPRSIQHLRVAPCCHACSPLPAGVWGTNEWEEVSTPRGARLLALARRRGMCTRSDVPAQRSWPQAACRCTTVTAALPSSGGLPSSLFPWTQCVCMPLLPPPPGLAPVAGPGRRPCLRAAAGRPAAPRIPQLTD